MAIQRAVHKKLPYDTLRDFIPISLLAEQANILVANPSVPAKSLTEFFALARSQSGKLSYGTPGIGTGTHLATVLLLEQSQKLNMLHRSPRDPSREQWSIARGVSWLLTPALRAPQRSDWAG